MLTQYRIKQVARQCSCDLPDHRGDAFLTNTGCFDICEKGPVVAVYPDNVWYGSVTPEDVAEILDSHIEGGKPVGRLLL